MVRKKKEGKEGKERYTPLYVELCFLSIVRPSGGKEKREKGKKKGPFSS